MSAYLDDELDPSSAAALAEHLSTCAACNKEYEELKQLKTTLKNGTNYSAPGFLRARIQADINSNKKTKKTFSWAWFNVAVATACSLTLALSTYLFLAVPTESERLDQEIVASHYRSLLAEHLSDVASSDHHTVKPWFTGKLDYSPPVYDFAGQGFSLVGGRLDYINQHTVAALIYRHNKHFINVFIWPDNTHKKASVESATMQGFQLLHWTQDNMAYSAVSDMSLQELTNFRQLLVAQIDQKALTPK
jgi:anti-sigma factor RsiW